MHKQMIAIWGIKTDVTQCTSDDSLLRNRCFKCIRSLRNSRSASRNHSFQRHITLACFWRQKVSHEGHHHQLATTTTVKVWRQKQHYATEPRSFGAKNVSEFRESSSMKHTHTRTSTWPLCFGAKIELIKRCAMLRNFRAISCTHAGCVINARALELFKNSISPFYNVLLSSALDALAPKTSQDSRLRYWERNVRPV